MCFGTAAVIGIPAYLLARSSIGGTGAMLLMIALMLPFFFLAMYERDGLPAEKVLRNILRATILTPRVRPYRTENFYYYLHKQGKEASKVGPREKQHSPKEKVSSAGAGRRRRSRPSLSGNAQGRHLPHIGGLLHQDH